MSMSIFLEAGMGIQKGRNVKAVQIVVTAMEGFHNKPLPTGTRPAKMRNHS